MGPRFLQGLPAPGIKIAVKTSPSRFSAQRGRGSFLQSGSFAACSLDVEAGILAGDDEPRQAASPRRSTTSAGMPTGISDSRFCKSSRPVIG